MQKAIKEAMDNRPDGDGGYTFHQFEAGKSMDYIHETLFPPEMVA